VEEIPQIVGKDNEGGGVQEQGVPAFAGKTNRRTDEQTNRRTDEQTNRRTDEQTNRRTGDYGTE
jgi:hypothetical protein